VLPLIHSGDRLDVKIREIAFASKRVHVPAPRFLSAKEPSSRLWPRNTRYKLEKKMSSTPHTLAEEFPGQMDVIHQRKISDPRFAQLLKDYDDVNDQVHRAETRIEPTEQLAENDLRKRRLQIKDSIAQALAR